MLWRPLQHDNHQVDRAIVGNIAIALLLWTAALSLAVAVLR